MGKTKADEYNWKLNFKRVRTLYYACSFLPDIPDATPANFTLSMDMWVSEDLKRIRLKVPIAVRLGEEKKDLASLHLDFTFGVEGLSEIASSVDELRLPHRLVYTAHSLAISTSRGILIEKGRGQLLEQFILPPVNPNDFIGEADEEGFAIMEFTSEEADDPSSKEAE